MFCTPDLVEELELPGSISGPANTSWILIMKSFQRSFPPYTDSIRGIIVSYWRKCGHLVLTIRLEGLSLSRNSVIMLTDRPDMTIAVYRRRTKTHSAHEHTDAQERDGRKEISFAVTIEILSNRKFQHRQI